MNVRLRMYDYCYSNLGAINAMGLFNKLTLVFYASVLLLIMNFVITFSK